MLYCFYLEELEAHIWRVISSTLKRSNLMISAHLFLKIGVTFDGDLDALLNTRRGLFGYDSYNVYYNT